MTAPMLKRLFKKIFCRRVMSISSSHNYLVLLAIICCLISTESQAQNLSQCSGDLEQLGREARQASSEARKAANAQSSFDQAVAELGRCIDYPDIYDLLHDGCQGKKTQAKMAHQQLEAALSSLNGALTRLSASLQSVNLSCGQGLSTYGLSHASTSAASGSTAPVFPSLSGSSLSKKQIGVLLAAGVIGALVKSSLDSDTDDRREEKNEMPRAPAIPRETYHPPLEIVDDGSSIQDSLCLGIPMMTTIGRDVLGDQRIKLLAELVKDPPDSIQGFRWGKSASPKGHELFGTIWYTTIFSNGRSVTLYAAPNGIITHKKVKDKDG